MTSSIPAGGPSGPSQAVPLHKGRACMNCRRRKIKCDGLKPMCGPCSRSSQSFRDCEYTDSGTTRTQLLEEQIAILEARLDELERPDDGSSPLALHNPYSEYQTGSSSSSSLAAQLDLPSRSSHSPRGFLTPSPQSSSTPEELPLILHQALLHNFLHHNVEFGFFLDVPRFNESALGPESERPSPALLNTVYLWGVHLSQSKEIAAYETTFASRALESTAQALSGTHPQRILHNIQAEVLLACYFFRNGRILEGKYHTSAAVSLVLSAGFHRIRTTDHYPAGLLLGPPEVIIDPPLDAIEEGERINAFWTVFILNNCWTTADGSPSNMSYGARNSRIDTPWPLSSYTGNPLENSRSSHTVQKFLASTVDDGNSLLALHSKASILFEQSARLVLQYHPEIQPQEGIRLSSQMNTLDSLIRGFAQSLPPIISSEPQSNAKTLMLVHIVTHVAAIQLHNPFILQNPVSHSRVLFSAKSIVQILNSLDLTNWEFVDPIIGTLLVATCQVLIAEISAVRTRRLSQAVQFQGEEDESDFVASLEDVMKVMAVFATCDLMKSQLHKVRGLYAAA